MSLQEIEKLELSIIDEDIRTVFLKMESGTYQIKLPTIMQLVRLMRRFVDITEKRNNDTSHSCASNNDVNQKTFALNLSLDSVDLITD